MKLYILPIILNTVVYSDRIQTVFRNSYFLPKISYNSLLNKIEDHQVKKIYFSGKYDSVISENIIESPISTIEPSIFESDKTFLEDYSITSIAPSLTNTLVDLSVKNNVEPVFIQQLQQAPNLIQTIGNDIGAAFNFILPILIISAVINSVRGNAGRPPGLFGLNLDFKKDKLSMIKANVSLQSFAGSPEIFEESTEIISYLKNETLYKNAGAEIPRGILLEGSPGTGKTLLAKAIASEADANFISISASEFIEVFVGVGASKIRSLFRQARENRPAIIFIDEIDSIGKQRGGPGKFNNGGNDEQEQTLNQLLAEMDGFVNNKGILVIAATNRKDILDAALLRPGRFDRIITVPLPDRKSRVDILKVHSQNKIIDPNINLEFIAELTSGFSGAQIKNLLNEAAILAVRKGENMIQQNDILEALDKLVVGIVRKIDNRGEEARKRVAIHEIGHALLCSLFKESFLLKKVSIQSTYNGAGGFTIFSEYPSVIESGLYTKDLLKKRLIIAMGGKAAENLYYGEQFISGGAIQDLKQANQLAQQMIGLYGMGNKLEAFYNQNLDGRGGIIQYSEKIKQGIDKECLELVDGAYQSAKILLEENKVKMDLLIQELLDNNILYPETFYKDY
jgi:cell division protease FtsH